MKEQLADKVVEKVETELTIEVTYLLHRTVVRNDKKMTKVGLFLMQVQKKGPSLNESIYKRPLLTPMLFDVLLRYFMWNIGLMVDIMKAYLQIAVSPTEAKLKQKKYYE